VFESLAALVAQLIQPSICNILRINGYTIFEGGREGGRKGGREAGREEGRKEGTGSTQP
jgi:hypothetical protein